MGVFHNLKAHQTPYYWDISFGRAMKHSGIKPMPPTVEAQSLNYWPTREVHHWDSYR